MNIIPTIPSRRAQTVRQPCRPRFTSFQPLAGRLLPVLLAGLQAATARIEAQAQVTVNLGSSEAVEAGAAWRMVGEAAWRDSGVAYPFGPGTYFLEFKPVEGWETPSTDLDKAFHIESDTHLSISRPYRALPLHPVIVTSTPGGFVHGKTWTPWPFGGLKPVSPYSANELWEDALNPFRALPGMPSDNAGWRLRLRAMAFPGYRFEGWSGDLSGTRNPAVVIANGEQRIQAHFSRDLSFATWTADRCDVPGVTTLQAQFGFRVGNRLETLRWKPKLPPGWTLTSVDGLGGPAIEGTEIVFNELFGHNPVQFNLNVRIPPEAPGVREVSGEVEYRLAGELHATVRSLTPLPVVTTASPAARLDLKQVEDRPALVIHGTVGRTYTIEQVPTLPSPDEHWSNLPWVFIADVTLTNTTQVVHNPPLHPPGGAVFYRATILE